MSNFYDAFRLEHGRIAELREDLSAPPERLLQAVWFHQRLLRDRLETLDGRKVQVLHPGFWNHESGPDFHNAVIQVGEERVESCDIEVDYLSNGWHAHGHDHNPAFRNVRLHVVWKGDSKQALPTLELKNVLDSPIEELVRWLGTESAQSFPAGLAGQCAAPLSELPGESLAELLRQAGMVRLQSKASQFQARARQSGWEQALWEGLFRALGYKHNVWPMQRVAELRPNLQIEKPDRAVRAHTSAATTSAATTLQARLLGVGGLLPEELTRKRSSTDQYVRRLWDVWWREREAFSELILPSSIWRFGGLRPANNPQRRLALAAHWLAAGDLPAKLECWAATSLADGKLLISLAEIFQPGADDFWSWHWTLRSARLQKSQPLIGSARVTDLAVNVVLPWLWARADEGNHHTVRSEIQRRYLAWPAAEDNAVLRLARQRLFGGSRNRTRALACAAAQQGLLQIVRDFCDNSNALCTNCKFPALVKKWSGGGTR